MSTPRNLLLALLLSAGSLFASEATPVEMRGILNLGGAQKFSLSSTGGAETAWVAVGDQFAGWTVKAYDAAKESLLLEKDGLTLTLNLEGRSVKAGDAAGTKATLADAEAVMRKMNLQAMIKKTIEQQKKMSVQMAKQMAARMGTKIDEEAMTVFQGKVMDVLFNEESIKAMSDDMTTIYSEVFSKEELQGLSDFYSTKAGAAMIDKTPVVQEKLAQAMMPRMMANMGKVQELSAEFAREQKAKADAAAAAAAPASEPEAAAEGSAAPATPTN